MSDYETLKAMFQRAGIPHCAIDLRDARSSYGFTLDIRRDETTDAWASFYFDRAGMLAEVNFEEPQP